uniref:Uncharacterized protein n=1 Tax=Rhizophagus irregularis (strain DAOM 181602 / DAOM 197198 / MUCL 43194) TaxID=747089 RepID=U9UH76_RHIID
MESDLSREPNVRTILSGTNGSMRVDSEKTEIETELSHYLKQPVDEEAEPLL